MPVGKSFKSWECLLLRGKSHTSESWSQQWSSLMLGFHLAIMIPQFMTFFHIVLYKHVSAHLSSQCFTRGVHASLWRDSAFTVLWIPFFKNMFGPEKNAGLSPGGCSYDDRPVLSLSGHVGHGLPCHFFFITAVRRYRPGVRCCSGHCGYDKWMGCKAPGP